MKGDTPLDRLIAGKTDPSLPHNSRSHPLTAYLPQAPEAPCYIKREDELSAGIVGSKLRKYLSLLPALERDGVTHVILIGGAHSNNVMSLSQLLIERGIGVSACLRQPGSRELVGNHMLLKMLVDRRRIRYLDHLEWPKAEQIAAQWAEEMRLQGEKTVVIAEGGDHPDVLPGILTLAADIRRNEAQAGISFQQIWSDAGTGITTIGLLLGLQLLGMSDRQVQITLIAGDEEGFLNRYRQYRQWLEMDLGTPLSGDSPPIRFLIPATARSFGSVNTRLLNETIDIARQTGILMDPVYSAKHLYTVKCAMAEQPPNGPQLILYNGGPLGLCGFQSALAAGVQ